MFYREPVRFNPSQPINRTKTKLRKDIFNKAYTKQNHIKQNRPRLQN